MTEKRLTTPINSSDLTELRVGDLVYLSGTMVTGRDEVYQRIVRQGRPSPVELKGLAVFHAGPIVRQTGGGWELVSIGPTTSMRMESCQAEFLEQTGAKIIVGKGGMGEKTAQACQKQGVIYVIAPGGCAALAAAQVQAIETAHWLDLSMGEAMWVLRVKDFGPLIVSIDTRGNNLFEANKRLFEERGRSALVSCNLTRIDLT
jgi:L(+)-tartrate dehydratase beta subunit